MKLRNKKTGEIKEIFMPEATTLKEFCDNYEDYEEPKEYWFIRDHTSAVGYAPADNNATAKYRKEIVGNYFETKEDAQKAVEKLKAWKRLKDKGFRFIEGYLDNNDNFIIKAKLGHVGLIDQPDVHLLFGGEE